MYFASLTSSCPLADGRFGRRRASRGPSRHGQAVRLPGHLPPTCSKYARYSRAHRRHSGSIRAIWQPRGPQAAALHGCELNLARARPDRPSPGHCTAVVWQKEAERSVSLEGGRAGCTRLGRQRREVSRSSRRLADPSGSSPPSSARCAAWVGGGRRVWTRAQWVAGPRGFVMYPVPAHPRPESVCPSQLLAWGRKVWEQETPSPDRLTLAPSTDRPRRSRRAGGLAQRLLTQRVRPGCPGKQGHLGAPGQGRQESFDLERPEGRGGQPTRDTTGPRLPDRRCLRLWARALRRGGGTAGANPSDFAHTGADGPGTSPRAREGSGLRAQPATYTTQLHSYNGGDATCVALSGFLLQMGCGSPSEASGAPELNFGRPSAPASAPASPPADEGARPCVCARARVCLGCIRRRQPVRLIEIAPASVLFRWPEARHEAQVKLGWRRP